jgi:hypothetical protein
MIDLDNIKELLIDQYLLHEVQHHSSHLLQGDESVPREPRAHSLLDIYKCLHQGEFGVGHLIDATDRFQNRLLYEMSRIRPTSDEPLLENVSIDGTVMRVNLRPFRAIFGDDIENACHILAEVCLRSSEIPKGDTERFFLLLNSFRDLNRQGELMVGKASYIFPTEMVDHFLKEVRKLAHRFGEVPVFSHSSSYRQLNEPSYRVVDVPVIQQSGLSFLFEPGGKRQLQSI